MFKISDCFEINGIKIFYCIKNNMYSYDTIYVNTKCDPTGVHKFSSVLTYIAKHG